MFTLTAGRPLHAFLNGEAAYRVLGHHVFNYGSINDGLVSPTAATFRDNYGVAMSGSYVWMGDSHNQRVTGFPVFPSTNFTAASILLGQADFSSDTYNIGALCGPSRFGVVPQLHAQGGRLFVSDEGNNRVLVYNSFPSSQQAPDLVLGQTDFSSSGYGSGANQLNAPKGVWFDGVRLYIADGGNHRVLIFNSLPVTNGVSADLVLGQPGFFLNQANQGGGAGAATLNSPFGVCSDGTAIAVADKDNQRVLIWDSLPAANGTPADKALGQADFSQTGANRGSGTAADTLNLPYGIALDSGKLFVADHGNNRVLVWSAMPVSSGAGADQVLGQTVMTQGSLGTAENRLFGCRGVSYSNGILAVADSGNNRVVFFQDLSPPASGWPDLDVACIGRLPRYPHYKVFNSFVGPGLWLPYLQPGTETEKRQPDDGEMLEYVATVMNKSTVTASAYDVRWLVDSIPVLSQASPGSLTPGASHDFTYNRAYDSGLRHEIGFEADVLGLLTETTKANNDLQIDDHALTLDFWVEQGIYDDFNQAVNFTGSRSFEDWMQAQITAMNLRFQQAIYPGAAAGIVDRIRVDRVTVVNDADGGLSPFATDPAKEEFDGRWSLSDRDIGNTLGPGPAGLWQVYADTFVMGLDWGLIHELGHQMGLIDEYRMNLVNDPPNNNGFHVLDASSTEIVSFFLPTFGFGQIVFQYPGLMGGGSTDPWRDPTYFSDHSTLAMNRHAGQRRGYFGEYLFDIPASLSVRAEDGAGNPLPGLNIEFFQRDPSNEQFDNTPEATGVTDFSGKFLLPNRVVTGTTTYTGHTLADNAFGQISLYGHNGTFFIRLSNCGVVSYHFMTLAEINVAYARGNTASYTYVLQAPALVGACGSPTITPTTTPSPLPASAVTAVPTPQGGGDLTAQAVPNPSSGQTTLVLCLRDGATGVEWKVFSAGFQMVKSGRSEQALVPGWNHIALDLRDLAEGTYYVRLRMLGGSHDGHYKTIKPLVVLR